MMSSSAKRRKLWTAAPIKLTKKDRPEEVTFDFDKREEYLTGFHKRKVERRKQAETIAKQKEKEERIQHRKEVRTPRPYKTWIALMHML